MRRSMTSETMIARLFVVKYLTIVFFKLLIFNEAMIVIIAMFHFSINMLSNIMKSVIYDRKSFSIDRRRFNLVILRMIFTIRNIFNNVKVINSMTFSLIKNIKTIKITIINNQFKIKTIIKINS